MAKKLQYEEAIQEMETIVSQLESGDLPLEEAIAAYKRGMDLSGKLEKLLGDAKRRVTILTPGGEEAPFGGEEPTDAEL